MPIAEDLLCLLRHMASVPPAPLGGRKTGLLPEEAAKRHVVGISALTVYDLERDTAVSQQILCAFQPDFLDGVEYGAFGRQLELALQRASAAADFCCYLCRPYPVAGVESYVFGDPLYQAVAGIELAGGQTPDDLDNGELADKRATGKLPAHHFVEHFRRAETGLLVVDRNAGQGRGSAFAEVMVWSCV